MARNVLEAGEAESIKSCWIQEHRKVLIRKMRRELKRNHQWQSKVSQTRQQRFTSPCEQWPSYLTWGKALTISKPQPSHLWNGDNDSNYPYVAWMRLLQGKWCKPLFLVPSIKWSWRNYNTLLISLSEYYQTICLRNLTERTWLLQISLSFACKGMMLLTWCLSLSNQ